MPDFAVAQIRVLLPDIHSQAAATSQQLFCSLRSSIGICVHTYIFKALPFSWVPVNPSISTAGEGEDVTEATSIPRLDQDPHCRVRIQPVQHRGLGLTARSEQWSRCTVLQITAEAQAAICTPFPASIPVPHSAHPAPRSPQPPLYP